MSVERILRVCIFSCMVWVTNGWGLGFLSCGYRVYFSGGVVMIVNTHEKGPRMKIIMFVME